MKKNIIISVSILLLVGVCALSSCRKLITDEFPDKKPKPTINSILQDGEYIQIHISLSGKIDTMPLGGVENAVVKLFENGTFVEILEYEDDGFYTSTISAKQGNNYVFEVSIPNFEPVRSEVYLPNSEFIRKIEHINNAGRDQDGLSCPALRITFTTNPSEQQFFELSVRMVSEHTDYTWDKDSNRWVSGATYTSYSPVTLLNIFDPVILGEGFPIPVFSNRMIRDTVYTMYLEYTTNRASSINHEPIQMTLYPLLIELRSISESYYHYLRSFYLYDRESAIGEIYPPHSLFSNVEGGFGIVGAFSKHTYDTIFPQR